MVTRAEMIAQQVTAPHGRESTGEAILHDYLMCPFLKEILLD
jgi:hypothetical protein